MKPSIRLQFEQWWSSYLTSTLARFPWVKQIAREAFYAGRRSKGEKKK